MTPASWCCAAQVIMMYCERQSSHTRCPTPHCMYKAAGWLQTIHTCICGSVPFCGALLVAAELTGGTTRAWRGALLLAAVAGGGTVRACRRALLGAAGNEGKRSRRIGCNARHSSASRQGGGARHSTPIRSLVMAICFPMVSKKLDSL